MKNLKFSQTIPCPSGIREAKTTRTKQQNTKSMFSENARE